MRIRTIKPEFFLHERLFDLEKETSLPLRLCFIGLWSAADREGRFRWEPRKLKSQIIPYDDWVDFEDILNALSSGKFIIKYAFGEKIFGFIPSFKDHQHVNIREAQSMLPAHDSPECTCIHVTEKVQSNIPPIIRKAVFERDGNTCKRCGRTTDLTVDHILPRSCGGTHAIENLRILCKSCNCARPVAGKDLEEDLAKDGFALDVLQRMCMHVTAHANTSPARVPVPVPVPVPNKGESERESNKLPIFALRGRLCVLFKRPENARWGCEEERLLCEVAKRDGCLSELGELEKFYAIGSYLPQKLERLLADWPGQLDRSRTHNDNQKRNQASGPNNRQRISASAGTSNEGTAASYANAPALSRAVGKSH